MAADIYVAENFRASRVNPPERSVWLDDTGCYWHLYRYFEGAKSSEPRNSSTCMAVPKSTVMNLIDLKTS